MQTGSDWKNKVLKLHRESYMWCLCCCNYDKELAKDVLQTVYLKIFDGRATFSKKSKLKTWLFSVIRFTSVDFRRKYGMRVEALNEIHCQIPALERNIDPDKEKPFKNILQALSGQQREVLSLVFYHDLTLEEIAPLMEISIGSVRTHYERGKENFKKLLIQMKVDPERL